MSIISACLLTYRDWYNEQVASSFTAPKCACGGVMLWSVNKCQQCASPIEIQDEIYILEWHINNDKQYKEVSL